MKNNFCYQLEGKLREYYNPQKVDVTNDLKSGHFNIVMITDKFTIKGEDVDSNSKRFHTGMFHVLYDNMKLTSRPILNLKIFTCRPDEWKHQVLEDDDYKSYSLKTMMETIPNKIVV